MTSPLRGRKHTSEGRNPLRQPKVCFVLSMLLCTNYAVDSVQFPDQQFYHVRQSAVLGCDRASVTDVGTVTTD